MYVVYIFLLRGGINNKKRDFAHRFATCDMSGAKSEKCSTKYVIQVLLRTPL